MATMQPRLTFSSDTRDQPELLPLHRLFAQIGDSNDKFCRVIIPEVVLTLRLLMSYIYGAPILDVSRSHTTTQHSR